MSRDETLKDFKNSIKDDINKVFSEFFTDNAPARNLVEVSDIGENALVEIAIIAGLKD